MNSIILVIYSAIFLNFVESGIMYEAYNKNVSCSGYIKILGSTNLNSFELEYSFGDNPVFFAVSDEGSPVRSSILNIPVEEFRGQSPVMERDFYALVKSERYPEIIIRFHGIRDSSLEAGKNIVKVGITMAGITHEYDILCAVRTKRTGDICLTGKKSIKITDFRLDPPVKFFGIVKMGEYIDVDFSVNFMTERQTNLLFSR